MQLQGYVDGLAKRGLTVYGTVVRQHNREIASHYWRTDERINIHSLSKSFLSCAVGIAIDEGLMKLDDQVISYFPEKLDASPTPWQEKLTIRNLLTMSSGLDWDEAYTALISKTTQAYYGDRIRDLIMDLKVQAGLRQYMQMSLILILRKHLN